MQNKSGRWVGFPIIAVVLVFCVFIIVIWRIGLFDFSGPDASAKIFPASLALVGGLFGSLISIIGLILKFSLDQRNTDIREQTECRLDLESKRNNAQKSDAEDRLKLEVAIQAVSLLSTSEGSPVPMVQRAGVLFALISLNCYDLALTLTSDLLKTDEIDAYSATNTLSRAMEFGDRRTQEEAVIVFHDKIEKFLTSDGRVEIPNSLYIWRENLSEYSREWGVIALAKLIISRRFSAWDRSSLLGILSAISLAWLGEEIETLKHNTGVILKSILPALPDLDWLLNPKQKVSIEEIRPQVASAEPATRVVFTLVEEIEKWATEALNSDS